MRSALATLRAGAAALLLLGCLDANNAPSRGIEVLVTTNADGFLVSWPTGAVVEVQVGRCSATCTELAPADPSTEFSELVPAPEFSELAWHVRVPSGALPPLQLGPTPIGGSVLVPFEEPAVETGAWAVFVVVETPRAQDVLTQVGVARLN